ncbi:MAG: pyruvate, phosphate dikinase [Bacteroidota bacterium]
METFTADQPTLIKPPSTSSKYVFSFLSGDGKNKQLLGGKGANLCEMTQIGLNVPPGFVVTTEACLSFLNNQDRSLPEGLMEQVKNEIAALEKASKKSFGSTENPLLVSVRSGSAISMPGMMDTILNLGLNDLTLPGLIAQTNDRRFAYDAYRRFIQLFGKVALGIDDEVFDEVFEEIKIKTGAKMDVELDWEALKEICDGFLTVVKRETGQPFPQDVYQQLEMAIKAVFNSWMGRRAIDYRNEFNITKDMANGTAVNVQLMVFGNLGEDCATGVAFTRDPGTGENVLFGEYLVNAQGEDVVAGIRTPKPVAEMEAEMPEMYQQLQQLRQRLENHYREIQDFEFTIEKQTLFCLQTRNGKMNATALVKSSVEMANSGLISKEQALLRIEPSMLEQLLFRRLDPNHQAIPLAHGLPASPGAAYGKCVFDADRAEKLGNEGQKVILVREETKPEDIHGFFASQGILTSRGGKTSHAAVVARSMGKPCVAGAEGITVNVKLRQAKVGGKVIQEGDVITIDGGTGYVYEGEIPTVDPTFSEELKILLGWADQIAELKVLANADTPAAAQRALDYGAMGIGLCRTERMFNAVERLPIVIEMILANTTEERQVSLNKLLPIQRADFKGLFKVMSPKPVTIRLLDPPIHEFLPNEETVIAELQNLEHLKDTVDGVNNLFGSLRLLETDEDVNREYASPFTQKGGDLVRQAITKKRRMLQKIKELHEVNPMLGHRGVRLGLTYPEIYKMQIQAVIEAAAECIAEGIDVQPEVMVPQVCTVIELKHVKAYVEELKAAIEAKKGIKVQLKFGSMIEVVRACMKAESLAKEAEFFSFGTNDLTQATYSFSREDAENKFLPLYQRKNIIYYNPFDVLDTEGVGKLMEITVAWGRRSKKDLKIGICGEQGGHPESIQFCHKIGLNYVSCSAPRVPIARLAAAQAALVNGSEKQ